MDNNIPLDIKQRYKWTLGDLNPRPSGCKPDALPTELSALQFTANNNSPLSIAQANAGKVLMTT